MENQAQQSFKNTKDKIEGILQYEDELRKSFSMDGARKIKKAFTVLCAQVETLIAGGVPAPLTSEERSSISEVVNLFMAVAIDRPVTPMFRDLTGSLLLLAHNWNQAVAKDADLDRKIKMINGVATAQMTLAETIEVIQKLLEKVKKTYQYEPPSFNLSRAYLENLKKSIEEKAQ